MNGVQLHELYIATRVSRASDRSLRRLTDTFSPHTEWCDAAVLEQTKRQIESMSTPISGCRARRHRRLTCAAFAIMYALACWRG